MSTGTRPFPIQINLRAMQDVSSCSSFAAASESFDAAPAPSLTGSDVDMFPSRSCKRKSRSQSVTGVPSRAKRLRALFTDDYRLLFNKTVLKAANRDSRGSTGQLRTSHLGITEWTSSEEAKFFRTLACKGRDDLPSVSAAIGTKSELEVRAFLLQLGEASTNQQVYTPEESLLDQSEIPAAFEISPECEAALDDAADALAILQYKEDVKAEKKKYGEDYRLTAKIAEKIHEQLEDNPNGEKEISDVVPAAILLNLRNFLTVMKRFFMNSFDSSYNYRTYKQRREHLSIFHTAFSDFHNLVVSVTRRLVLSALFLAMSRRRATEQFKPRKHVKRIDVKAAFDVLDMKADAHKYWVGLARRCKLHVFENHRSDRLEWDVVERILDRSRNRKGRYPNERWSRLCQAVMLLNGSGDASDSSSTASESTSSDSSSDDNFDEVEDKPLNHHSPSTESQQDQDEDEDAYISALDHEASLRDEKHLWECLSRDPPSVIIPEYVDIPFKPDFEPKPLEDIGDWRTSTPYAAEWEVHERPIPKSQSASSSSSSSSISSEEHRARRSDPKVESKGERGAGFLNPENTSGHKALGAGRSANSDVEDERVESERSSAQYSVRTESAGQHDGAREDAMETSDSENGASSEISTSEADIRAKGHSSSIGGVGHVEQVDDENTSTSEEDD